MKRLSVVDVVRRLRRDHAALRASSLNAGCIRLPANCATAL